MHGASPLRGRYLATDWRLRALLGASDLLLAGRRHRAGTPPSSVRRVLLSVNGHLGDAVIASAAIRALAQAVPAVEVGVLLPSWSRAVLDGHPHVRYRHVVDHWHTSRTGGVIERWATYRRTRRSSIREIRQVGYDAAVDLYEYFPNAALLLRLAGIPVRVGFNAAGFSALYTHAVPWPNDHRHTAERHLVLLRTLLPTLSPQASPRPWLPDASADTVTRVAGVLHRHGVRAGEYTVIHPGAGAPSKEWPSAKWRTLAGRLAAAGIRMVFTGRGEREHAQIRAIAGDLRGAIDLCDCLEWAELVQVIRLARNVVALDSAAGHVAAAVGTPVTVLWTSPGSPSHWGPLGDATVVPGSDAPEKLARTIQLAATTS